MDDQKRTPQTPDGGGAMPPEPAKVPVTPAASEGEPTTAEPPAAPSPATPVPAAPAPAAPVPTTPAPAAPEPPAAPMAPASPTAPAAPSAPAAGPAPAAPPAPAAAPQQPSSGQQVPPPPPGSVPPAGQGVTPPPPGQPYYPPTAPASKPSGKAIAALVCGILSILFSWTVLPSIILGIVALVLASSARKMTGPDSRITAGRVTAAIGLVLSALALVFAIAFSAFVGTVLSDPDEISRRIEADYQWSYPDDGSYGSQTYDPSTATEEETAVNDVVVAAADQLVAQDPQVMAALSASLEEEMRDSTEYLVPPHGLSFADLGVDPQAFASWVLGSATYEVTDLYVYSAIDEADAMLTFTVPDSWQFSEAFHGALIEKIAALDMTSPTYADDVRASAAAALEEAKAATVNTESINVDVEVDRQGGTWAIDQDWYEDLFDPYFW